MPDIKAEGQGRECVLFSFCHNMKIQPLPAIDALCKLTELTSFLGMRLGCPDTWIFLFFSNFKIQIYFALLSIQKLNFNFKMINRLI